MPENVTETESSSNGATETHFKVKVPTERLVRLREADPGMVLARDVNNRNEQLLFPRKTTLDEKAIRKLRNFGKRSVHVKDYHTKWVDQEEFENLPNEAEWLDTKEVPAAPQHESDGDGRAGSSEETKFSKAFDFVTETDSPRRLKEFVATLGERMTEAPEGVDVDLESLREQTGEVEDLVQYIMAQMTKLNDSKTRQQVLENLLESEGIPEKLLDNSDVPEEMILDLENLREDKHTIKQMLQELLHDQPEAVETLDHEEIPDTNISGSSKEMSAEKSTEDLEWDEDLLHQLLDLLALSDEDAQTDDQTKTLISELNDFLERKGFDQSALSDRIESDQKDLTGAESVYEDLSSEELELLDDRLKESVADEKGVETCMLDAFQAMDKGKWSEAIKGFNSCLKENVEGGFRPSSRSTKTSRPTC